MYRIGRLVALVYIRHPRNIGAGLLARNAGQTVQVDKMPTPRQKPSLNAGKGNVRWGVCLYDDAPASKGVALGELVAPGRFYDSPRNTAGSSDPIPYLKSVTMFVHLSSSGLVSFAASLMFSSLVKFPNVWNGHWWCSRWW
jgi:hypothetical protein